MRSANALELDDLRLEPLLERLDGADEHTLLATATAEVVGLLGDSGACILLQPWPHVCHVTGEQSEALTTRIDLHQYPEIEAALESRDVVVFENAGDAHLHEPARTLFPPGVGSIAVVPILAGENRLGALVVRSSLPRVMPRPDRAAARLIGLVAGLLLAAHRRSDRQSGRETVDYKVTPIHGIPVYQPKPRGILVVDDDASHARTLEMILSDEGYDVTVASDGEQALALAREAPPDLVLLDVRMPGLDGVTVARELAHHRRTASVPVLLVSAADDLPSRARDCRRNELDFLQKPYSTEELLARVDRCLQEADALQRLNRTARIDELTGLGNVRLLEERLAVEASRVGRYRTPLTMALMDVDGLKAINDKKGHMVGSAVLKAIGQALGAEVRETDVAVRYGGDEFVVLLPHTDLTEGVAFCRRLLDRIGGLHPHGLSLSVSIGVASYDDRIDRGSLRRLLERADRVAYSAKRRGGNRVCADGALAERA